MKYIIILGDGMADHRQESLGNKTPLEVANIPTIDFLSKMGRNGLFHTVPENYLPGSEIANLSVLGYDLDQVFEGRGSLEAASMGVDVLESEMVMRCNLITIEDENIKNHSAGHISTEEARELMEYLEEKLGNDIVTFYPGVSYRHLLKVKGGVKYINCTPPHDVPGQKAAKYLPVAETPEAEQTCALLNELIVKSQELLKEHPVNLKRVAEGKCPANSIWMWSPGYRPTMPTLLEKYGLKSGAVISAVDLIKGIGIYAGLESIDVEGATGLYDTNYEGKAQAAIDALKRHDFVFLHIEASDEAGHEGDEQLKIKTIEYLDKRAVEPIFKATEQMDEQVTIAILPDHPTPCELKTHSREAVPFIIYNPTLEADSVEKYDEFSASKGVYGEIKGDEFMDKLIIK
ncbi:MAG: cofactor-independent phosphoglycerate mutase [Rikenellaceae bacterium]